MSTRHREGSPSDLLPKKKRVSSLGDQTADRSPAHPHANGKDGECGGDEDVDQRAVELLESELPSALPGDRVIESTGHAHRNQGGSVYGRSQGRAGSIRSGNERNQPGYGHQRGGTVKMPRTGFCICPRTTRSILQAYSHHLKALSWTSRLCLSRSLIRPASRSTNSTPRTATHHLVEWRDNPNAGYAVESPRFGVARVWTACSWLRVDCWSGEPKCQK